MIDSTRALSERDAAKRAALAERLAGRSPVVIDADDIGTPHLSEDNLPSVSQRMLDAGIEVLDAHDSLIHEMATTYDAFTQNRKSVELILHDVWQAMFHSWLVDGAEVQSVMSVGQKNPFQL